MGASTGAMSTQVVGGAGPEITASSIPADACDGAQLTVAGVGADNEITWSPRVTSSATSKNGLLK